MAHDLIFANARVKARENNLLTRDKLLRMTEGSLSDAFSILSESLYDVESGDVDTVCAKEEKKLLDFIKELEVDKPFINCLIAEYDYRAVKRAYKMKAERRDFEFSPTAFSGFVPLDKVKSTVLSDDYDIYMPALKSALHSLDEKSVTKGLTPTEVETAIDKAMFEDFLIKLSGKTGEQYFKERVFLTNLITLMRVNRLGLDADFFDLQYVGERNGDYESMISLVGESAEAISEKYRVSVHHEVVDRLISGDVDSAEAYADDTLIRSLSLHKADMFSELSLAGYFIAKRAEIGNVRLILTCIKNNVSADEATKRLRVCYYE